MKSLNARSTKQAHHKQRLLLNNKEVLLKPVKIVTTSKKYWLLYIDFEKFGIYTFRVYSDHPCRCCFPVGIRNTGKRLFVEVSF